MSDGSVDVELKLDAKKAKADASKAGKDLAKAVEGAASETKAGDILNKKVSEGGKSGGVSAGKSIAAGATAGAQSAGSFITATIGKAITAIPFDGISKGLESASKAADNVGTKLTNSITKPAMLAATALASITIGAGLSRLIAIDTAKAKLEALGNTGENVANIMNDATSSVKGTAFSLGEAATAAGMAVASGVAPGKELVGYLSTVADTAAVAGVSMETMGANIGQVFATGSAYLGDLNKMVTAGIPIFEYLADEMDVTTAEVKKMAANGTISSEVFLSALKRNLGPAATIASKTGQSVAEVNAQLDAIREDGVASLDELGSMADNNVPIWEALAKTMGLSVDEVMNLAAAGQITTEQFDAAVESFGGAAKAIGEKSFTGALANMWASIGRIGANFLDAGGKGGGFFSTIKPLITEFTGYLGSAEDVAKDWGVSIGTAFSQAVEFVRSNSDVIMSSLSDIGRNFGEVFTTLKTVAGQAIDIFKGLQKSTQDWLIKLVAIAPAAALAFGPILKLVSPILGIMSKLTGAVGSFVGAMSKIGGLSGGISAVATKLSDMGGIGAAATSALKTGLVGLGVVVAGLAVNEFIKYQKRQDTIKTATDGLVKSTDAFAGSFGKVNSAAKDTSGIDASRRSVDDLYASTEKTTEQQADLATSMSETWSGIGDDSALLMGYVDTIDRLAGKTAGSAEKQAELAIAVAGVNEITGSTYKIVDSTNGILDVSTEAIDRNTGSWLANAMAQAAQEEAVELGRQKIQIDNDLADIQDEITTATTKLTEAQENQKNGVYGAGAEVDRYSAQIEYWNGKADEQKEKLDANAEATQRLTDLNADATAKTALSAGAIQAYTDSQGELVQKFADTEKSADLFAGSLSDLGLTQEELAQLTPTQISGLIDAWDGTTTSIEDDLGRLRADMSYSLGPGTAEAVDGMLNALATGNTLTAGEIATLKEVVENPLGDMAISMDETTRAGVEAIIANLAAGQPITAEQALLLREGLATATGGIDAVFGSDAQAAIDAANAVLVDSAPMIGGSAAGVKDASVAGVSGADLLFGGAASGYVSAFNSPLTQALGTYDASTALPTEADKGAKSTDGSGAGENFALGFLGGIGDWLGEAWTAGWNLVTSALSGGNKAQESASPAKKTKLMGKWFVLGFRNELSASEGKAYDAGHSLISSAISGASDPISSAVIGQSAMGSSFVSNFADGVRASLPVLDVALNDFAALAETKLASIDTTDLVQGKIQAGINNVDFDINMQMAGSIDNLSRMNNSALASLVATTQAGFDKMSSRNQNIYIDGSKWVGATGSQYDSFLGREMARVGF